MLNVTWNYTFKNNLDSGRNSGAVYSKSKMDEGFTLYWWTKWCAIAQNNAQLPSFNEQYSVMHQRPLSIISTSDYYPSIENIIASWCLSFSTDFLFNFVSDHNFYQSTSIYIFSSAELIMTSNRDIKYYVF